MCMLNCLRILQRLFKIVSVWNYIKKIMEMHRLLALMLIRLLMYISWWKV